MSTWVLTPCHQPRLSDLQELLTHLNHPADRTVVVTTQPHPIHPDSIRPGVTVLVDHEPGINISRWWNLGLEWIAEHAEPGPYEVLYAESDTRINGRTLQQLVNNLRGHRLAMVGADWFNVTPGAVEIRRDLDPGTIEHRIPGVCMLVAGELQLRFDEQFRWWYADDDFEWQHRKAAGTGLVGGLTIQHGPGRVLTGERAQYTAEDYQRFPAKWGAPNIR